MPDDAVPNGGTKNGNAGGCDMTIMTIKKIKRENIKSTTKRVNKEEFEQFIANYPHPLEKDICGISDPPLVSYNDFKLGAWPKSIVASTFLYEDTPEDYYYEPKEERKYFIVENHEELL